MNKIRKEAWLVGLVLGAVWLIMGGAYGNFGLIALGIIMLALGMVLRLRHNSAV